MKESLNRSYRLAEKLSYLYDLQSKIDPVLSVSMYFLSQFLDSKRSSVFLYEPWHHQLTIFSSLDLNKHEIRIPGSSGVAGWVFENRKPAIINDAYADRRFCKEIDRITGFRTSNLICTPLCDCNGNCMGTLQSLNKTSGNFTSDDLELLNLAARMVAIAITNSRRYRESMVTNQARKKIIGQLAGGNQRPFPVLV